MIDPLSTPQAQDADLGLLTASRPATRRLLSGALPPPTATGAGFADLTALRAAVAVGNDPLLYEAWRDVLPPRPKLRSARENLADSDFWFADLVVYQQGWLVDGQPVRSTGHWNSPLQLEIFQLDTGTVLMLAARRRADGHMQATYQICQAGDVAVTHSARGM